MTTSSYMPNVVVEIAFNSGYGTAAGSRTWVDVSDYLELDAGMSISVGRGDERASADANRLTLTLDNRDGRFTPGRVTSPYYPNVKLDRPIRVTATPVDGPASVRFLGFISEWPVEWEGSDGYAKVTISASSRLARLGLAASLQSIVEETILADGPAVYYTLGEPAGALQANDSSGLAKPPLAVVGDPALPIVFGTAIGPGTDGLTAAQFSGGQYLAQTTALSFASGGTIECFVLKTDVITGGGVISIGPATELNTAAIAFQAGTGKIAAYSSGSNLIATSGNMADGRTHHVALTVTSGGTWTLYVDGVSVGSASNSPLSGLLQIAGPFGPTPGLTVTGVVAHAAVFTSVLSAAQIAAHATAGLTGFSAELTDARLKRYTALGGVAAAEVNAEAGQTSVAHVEISGKQVVELLRLVEATEGGVLFDHRSGVLTMHNRLHRLTSSSAYTLDMTQHMVEAGYSPKLDRSTLLNDVTATNVDGTATARKIDAASRTDNGLATATIETASADKDQPNDIASWMVYKYATPKVRVAALSVDALAQVGKTPNCAAVMATDVGTKMTVAGHPQQAAYSSVDYFAEGYTEVYGPESLRFEFNVSPSSPDDLVLVVDDPARGVVDTNPVAF